MYVAPLPKHSCDSQGTIRESRSSHKSALLFISGISGLQSHSLLFSVALELDTANTHPWSTGKLLKLCE